jgi:sugar lactone lactonase YvrE
MPRFARCPTIGLPARLFFAAVGAAALVKATDLAGQQDYGTPYYFTTLAGASSIGVLDGSGRNARFNQPYGIARDRAGNLYVADWNNHAIRKVTPAGVVSTLAGMPGTPGASDGSGSDARFFFPIGVAVDSNGNVLVADAGNDTIRRVTPAGVVTTMAGAAGQAGSADGPARAARFNRPSALAVDAAGNILISDSGNSVVRKLATDGSVATVAGTVGNAGWADGAGPAARFFDPIGIGVDAGGNIYVADRGNRVIRKIAPGSVVTTLAGAPGLGLNQKGSPDGGLPDPDGVGLDARFDAPTGLTLDANGVIYVSDDTSTHFIRRVTPAGAVTTVGISSFISPVVAPFGERLESVLGLAVADDGSLLLSDYGNNCIRRLDVNGVLTTFAGLPYVESAGWVDGPAGSARFTVVGGPVSYLSEFALSGLAAAPSGDLYVMDTDNAVVRKVDPSGNVTTVAGAGRFFGFVDGQGAAARFNYLTAIAADGAGNVYVADSGTIRKLTPTGLVTTLAGSAGFPGAEDGTGLAARFTHINAMTCDGAGNIYAVDGSPDLVSFTPIAVRRITPQGGVSTLGNIATADTRGIAVDAAGNLYLDSLNTIVKVTPDGGRTVLAGQDVPIIGNEDNLGADGTGSAARFRSPGGIALGADNNLYVADTGDNTIRQVTPSGQVTTMGGLPSSGNFWSFNSIDGVGASARFLGPRGLAVGARGEIYIADGTSIRQGRRAGAPVISNQPRGAQVSLGDNVQLTVVAAAVPAATYQWYKDGREIPGATGDTLTLAQVSDANLGGYAVVVSNALGSVTSSTATIALVPASQPPAASSSGGGEVPAWFAEALLLFFGLRAGCKICRGRVPAERLGES